jgi:hypothetical protein
LTLTQCPIEVPVMDQRLHDFIREPIYLREPGRRPTRRH